MSSTTNQTHDDAHAADGHGHGGHDAHHGGPDHVPHVTPLSTYFAVFGTLVVLTIITVAVSRYDFGAANLFIAMLVATIKGTVVAAYFMHLKGDEKMNTVLLCSAFVFLAIFIGLTGIDVLRRGQADPMEAKRIYSVATPFDAKATEPPPEFAPGGLKGPGHGGHGGGDHGAPAGDHGDKKADAHH